MNRRPVTTLVLLAGLLAVPGFTVLTFTASAAPAVTHATTRASVATGGTQANRDSFGPAAISANGRYIAFGSSATNLVVGATGGVFVRDRVTGTTTLVSVATGGAKASGAQPAISANGRYVAFGSIASNLVAGDTNGSSDVFVRARP